MLADVTDSAREETREENGKSFVQQDEFRRAIEGKDTGSEEHQ